MDEDVPPIQKVVGVTFLRSGMIGQNGKWSYYTVIGNLHVTWKPRIVVSHIKPPSMIKRWLS